MSIQNIVEKAAYLHERIPSNYDLTPPQHADQPSAVYKRMAVWREQAATGDVEHFKRRFEWDSLNGNTSALLQGVRLSSGAALPSWAACLDHIMQRAVQTASFEAPFLDAADQVPFEHLFVPFVQEGIAQLRGTDSGTELLTAAAHRHLQRALLARLSSAAEPTLTMEFSAWLAAAGFAPEGDRQYRAFINDLRGDGLKHLFATYPVLARLLAQLVELWSSFALEFFRHLRDDRQELLPLIGKSPGRVAAISTGLSDPHNGGRSVLKLTFENAASCFYKPKCLASEELYDGILVWLESKGAVPRFRTVKRLCRDDHGWAQTVLPCPCENHTEVERYYGRLGSMLCLLYVLGANDCHFENILADGEYPVLIDAETLFQPLPNPLPDDPRMVSSAAAQAFYHASVLRVGMLPRWRAGKNGRKLDMTTLGGADGERGSTIVTVCEHPNTDQMRFTTKVAEAQSAAITCDGMTHCAARYVDQIERGFTDLYLFLTAHPQELLHWLEQCGNLKTLPLRYIVRNTHVYFGIIKTLLRPQHLKDGADTSIQAEVLARRFLYSPEKPQAWPIVEAERRKVLQLDVPYFSCTPASCDLQLGDANKIEGYFTEPAIETVRKCLSQLGRMDLALQVSYIRHCFGQSSQPASATLQTTGEAQDIEPLTSSAAIEEALRIAHDIDAAAIRGASGAVAWITHAYNSESQFWQLQPMGLRLYDGSCGVGLFLAALVSVTGDPQYKPLAVSAFQAVSDNTSKQLEKWLRREGLGAGVGIASIIYALLQAGTFLKEERFERQALLLSRWISPEWIRSDEQLDIMSGSAGCLLSLLKLHQATHDSQVLETAVACGDHLLAMQRATKPGPRAWKTVQGRFLAGFSHGAAGIACALARLSAVSGDSAYSKAAEEACEYESSLWNEEQQNWPNLLISGAAGSAGYWNSWCHGAPGMGLGRLAGLAALDNSSVRRDIERGLAKASEPALNSLDHPCCGTLGRIEVLLEAGRTLNRPDCLIRARVLAANVVQNARRQGGYAMGLRTDLYLPSFFQGMSGVGYQLLRTASTDRLPSVLSFQ